MALSTARALDTMDTIKSVGKKVSTFVSGVTGSLVRGALIKPSEVLYPFALQERYVRHIGIDVPEVFTEGIDDYTDATDRFVLRMAGKVEDWTLYYAGRCTGDALYTAAGFIEGVYGFTQAFAGGAAVIGEAISGGGAVLIPGTLAVAAQGVAIAIDGAATAAQGLDMMQGDLGRYQQSKEKEADNSWGTEPKGHGKPTTNLSAGKNFKDHYVRHKGLLEKITGKKYPKYKYSNNGTDFLQDLQNLISDGTLEYQGLGTLKKGVEPMNVYRGKGVTLITKTNGEFVTLLESGIGMDLSIQILH